MYCRVGGEATSRKNRILPMRAQYDSSSWLRKAPLKYQQTSESSGARTKLTRRVSIEFQARLRRNACSYSRWGRSDSAPPHKIGKVLLRFLS